MPQLRRSGPERRAESHQYRRERHVDNNAFRLAGMIFADSLLRNVDRTDRRQSMQKVRPVGYGFGVGDRYGPDDSYESVEPLRYTHDRDHYIAGGNHGFSVQSR